MDSSRKSTGSISGDGNASKSLRVLVADDHDIVHHGLRRLFADHFSDLTYGEARNAEQALALCAQQTWDVVLLDITMPDRSGLDVLPEMKRMYPDVPVLIASAFPEEEFAVRSLQCGASGYLDKRTLASEVVTAIKRVRAGECYVSARLAGRLAAQIGGRDGRRVAHDALSRREFQVLRLIASGKTIKEIASELSLSEKTVGTYRTRISEKLGVGTNVEITRYAMQHHLVD